MDPTQAIIAPWMQYGVIGSVVVALGVVAYMQWQHIKILGAAHLADVRACGDKMGDLLVKKIESDNALANALERLSDRMKA